MLKDTTNNNRAEDQFRGASCLILLMWTASTIVKMMLLTWIINAGLHLYGQPSGYHTFWLYVAAGLFSLPRALFK